MKNSLTPLLCFAIQMVAFSQNELSADLTKINLEGREHSQVMQTLITMSDKYGQRLTGSREYLRASKWTITTLQNWGLQEVHTEKYCDDCRGWSVRSFDASMVSPYFFKLTAYPLAQVSKTNGTVTGEAFHISSHENMEQLKAAYAGKLRGKIIIDGNPVSIVQLSDPLSRRATPEQLQSLVDKTTATRKQDPLPKLLKSFDADRADSVFLQFLQDEGALAVFQSGRGVPGIAHVQGTYFFREHHLKPLPIFALSPDHFNKILRMLKENEHPAFSINLDAEFYMEPQNNVNVIAEIQGSDKKLKSEVVMIGGHFDSWHGASGSTDNGAGVAVLMEAMRIIKATGLKPKRTIRLALWGGEEQAYEGSVAYARSHFGNLDAKPSRESEKVSAYLNVDNGAGAIRGLFLQENANARQMFQDLIQPLDSLGVKTLTLENTFGTDHDVLDHYKIPAFQVIQDPLAYYSFTHHTNVDCVDAVSEEDLKKNSIIMATLVYELAMADRMVPRKQ
jgi:carboxypeptidase Q